MAAVALAVHMVFVAFTVLGGFLAMLLPWVLLPHIAAAAWGARQGITRAACPLSNLENWGRTGAGRPPLREGGFIAHYFEGRVYPVSWKRRVETLVGSLVLTSWAWLLLR